MSTQLIDRTNGEIPQQTFNLFEGKSLNFSVIARDGREAFALKSLEVHAKIQVDTTIGGGAVDTKQGLWRAVGIYADAGFEQNPNNTGGMVHINPNVAGASPSRHASDIVHETLHLDREINARKREAIEGSQFDGLNNDEKELAANLIEHKR